MTADQIHRLTLGAVASPRGVSFRVWAPRRKSVHAVLETPSGSLRIPLEPETGGYFRGTSRDALSGTRYRFQLDEDDALYPDPASRFQPEGPHGPSEVVDPLQFAWTDNAWPGVSIEGQVLYEMHVGTFTPEGTWAAAAERLPHLAAVGVTVIEVMPVSDFSGDFGWGYDGVNLFAPTRLYGTPDDFRRFVDRAHSHRIGVILDVVYNHFGPDGNYIQEFSRDYFSDRHKNDWGESINFDGENSAGVREFYLSNAAYWIREFHLDGLRIDATQDIHDDSDDHILGAITRAARAAAGNRSIIIVAENEPQHVKHVMPPDKGGLGMDALWNDDLHHSAMAALTGRSEAYYTDYRGTPQEFLSALKWGYLYQGQYYKWQKKRRGTPALRLKPAHFVTFLQNHDQVANSATGKRCQQFAHPGDYRALTALILLGPGTPMLFQGQEFSASTPFLYFAAHSPELARLISEGREKFLSQFPSTASPAMQARLADPSLRATFERSKLDWSECETHRDALQMHSDLLHLRHNDAVLAKVLGRSTRDFDGAVLGDDALVLRYFDVENGDDRLLLVNLGRDFEWNPAPEPLLAESAGCDWNVAWSSEDPCYGGYGTPPLEQDGNWFLPGHSAFFLTSRRSETP